MITLTENPSPEHPAGRTLKINTTRIDPPVPSRRFDWVATVDGHEGRPSGHGETETEAVQELLEAIGLDDVEWERPQ